MKTVTAILLAMLSLSAGADQQEEFNQAYMGACEKMKSCTLQKLQGRDMPPEAKTMMINMLENTCQQMKNRFNVGLVEASLYQASIACMKSIADLSCGDIERSDGHITPQCAQLSQHQQR